MGYSEQQLQLIRGVQKRIIDYQRGFVTVQQLVDRTVDDLELADDPIVVGPCLLALPALARPILEDLITRVESGTYFRGWLPDPRAPGYPWDHFPPTPEELRRYDDENAPIRAAWEARMRRLGRATRDYYECIDAGYDPQDAFAVPLTEEAPSDKEFWDELVADLRENGDARWAWILADLREPGGLLPRDVPLAERLRSTATVIFEYLQGVSPSDDWA